MTSTDVFPGGYSAAPRDPDHEVHLQMDVSSRDALATGLTFHPADDHGVPLLADLGHWTVLPGTDLEVLVTRGPDITTDADEPGPTRPDVHLVYRLRRDVPR